MLTKIAAVLKRDGLLETLEFLQKKLVRIQKHQVYIASCAGAEASDWLPDEQVCFSSRTQSWDPIVSEQLVALGAYNNDYLEAVSGGEAEGLAALHNDKVVHYAFLMHRNKTTRLLGFDDNAGLLGHAFTAHQYRGRGCQARSVAARIKMAEQAGLDEVISATSYENISSQRGLIKGGMKLFGRVELCILFNVLVVRYRRPHNSIKRVGLCW